MHPTAEEFQAQAQTQYRYDVDVCTFNEGTKSAADAAAAIGCDLGQIVKSIVMCVGDRHVLVLTSGAHRVDEQKLAGEFNVEPDVVRTADANEVKETTGWSIGGVPPFCHKTDLTALADPSFKSYNRLWGAAGTPDTMFPLTPDHLVKFVDPAFVDVYE